MPSSAIDELAIFPSALERQFALDLCRATETAALAASQWIGRGDERASDLAAQTAMHRALSHIPMSGRVVIGEGEEGQAPLFYIGEIVGTGEGAEVDIAIDPLEGTNITATGGPNALSVIALTERGGLLSAPDVYMDKIAVGSGLPADVVGLDASPAENLAALASAKSVEVSDLLVCILNRPRHEELIAQVREAGARIMLISDGDMSGIIATALPNSGVDLYIGTGGAPEGIIAAAALRCIGGQMQARLAIRSHLERAEAERRGITDFSRVYSVADLARGEVLFAATGLTDGAMLRGVRRGHAGAWTHSLLMCSRSGTIRTIDTAHHRVRRSMDRN